jgi:hypothetical protein
LSQLPSANKLAEIKGDLLDGLNQFINKFGFTPKVILQFNSTYYIDTRVPIGV